MQEVLIFWDRVVQKSTADPHVLGDKLLGIGVGGRFRSDSSSQSAMATSYKQLQCVHMCTSTTVAVGGLQYVLVLEPTYSKPTSIQNLQRRHLSWNTKIQDLAESTGQLVLRFTENLRQTFPTRYHEHAKAMTETVVPPSPLTV